MQDWGAGRAVPKEATPTEIADAIGAVLHDHAMKAAAERFASATAALGYGEHTCDLLEDLLVKETRVGSQPAL